MEQPFEEMTQVIDNDEELKGEAAANHLMEQLKEMEMQRNFYFSKLRDTEIICVEADEVEGHGHLFIKQILDVLYRTADGFVSPDVADDDD